MSSLKMDSLKQTKSSKHSSSSSCFPRIPTRFVIILLGIFANAVQYTIRVNLSVTIVAMVNGSASVPPLGGGSSARLNLSMLAARANAAAEADPDSFCPLEDEDIAPDGLRRRPLDKTGEFDWSQNVQGIILGAFYYGYILTNISAGQLAEYIGPRWMVAMSLFTSSVLTILTPLAAHWHYGVVVALRVLTGLAQGLLSPAVYSLFARWVPKQERRIALALILVGGNIGTILTMPLSGFLCQSELGWPSVFYVLGAFGFFWTVLWMYCVHNSPDVHPRISEDEMLYIHSNLDLGALATKTKRKALKTPWTKMILSPAVWAVCWSRFAGQFGNLMLMSKLPAYLESVLHFPIEKNGMVNAMVYGTFSISLTLCGWIADVVSRRNFFSKTANCKIFQTIALGGPAVCLLLIPLVGCSQEYVVALIVIGMTIFGFQAGGDNPIVVDMAPDFSGSLYGFTNSFGSLPGFLAPQVVGLILNNTHGDRTRWADVFYLTSGIYAFGILMFVCFGSAEVQPWGKAPKPPRSRHASRQEHLRSYARRSVRITSIKSLNPAKSDINANTNSFNQDGKPESFSINLESTGLGNTLSVSRMSGRRPPRSRSVSRNESLRIVDVMGLNSVEEHLVPEQPNTSDEETSRQSDSDSCHTLHEEDEPTSANDWTNSTADTVVRPNNETPLRSPIAQHNNGPNMAAGYGSMTPINIQWLSPYSFPLAGNHETRLSRSPSQHSNHSMQSHASHASHLSQSPNQTRGPNQSQH